MLLGLSFAIIWVGQAFALGAYKKWPITGMLLGNIPAGGSTTLVPPAPGTTGPVSPTPQTGTTSPFRGRTPAGTPDPGNFA